MKTKLFYIGAMILAVCSCAKENVNNSSNEPSSIPTEPMTLTVGTMTRTSLDGKNVLWSEGDVVSVISNVQGAPAVNMNVTEINGATATISGDVAVGTTELMMVYPTSSLSSSSFNGVGSTMTVNLPADQTAVVGTFANNSNISVAYATKTPGEPEVGIVAFHNVCGMIKFAIPSNIENVKKVVFTNSGTDAIAGQYTVNPCSTPLAGSSVAGGSTSITMSGDFVPGSQFCILALPSEVKGFTITMETATKAYSIVSKSEFTVTSGSSSNLGSMAFKEAPTVTYAHVNSDIDDKFAGTEITLSNANISDGETTVTIKNSEGALYRTLKYVSRDNITFEVDEEKPYLPAGSYTAEFKYAVGTKSYGLVSSSFDVKAPDASLFTLTLNEPVTSYSKYLAGDIAGANLWTNDKVGNLGATVNISDAVLKQMEEKTVCEFLVDRESKVSPSNAENGKFNFADQSGLSWANHTIGAKITFDGVEIKSEEKSFVITGLPRSCPVTKTEFSCGRNTSEESGYLKLGGGTGDATATSKSFYCPADASVNVAILVNAKVFDNGTLPYNYFSISVGETSEKFSGSKNGTEYSDINIRGIFSESVNTFTMDNSYTAASIFGVKKYSYVNSCKIEYR